MQAFNFSNKALIKERMNIKNCMTPFLNVYCSERKNGYRETPPLA